MEGEGGAEGAGRRGLDTYGGSPPVHVGEGNQTGLGDIIVGILLILSELTSC